MAEAKLFSSSLATKRNTSGSQLQRGTTTGGAETQLEHTCDYVAFERAVDGGGGGDDGVVGERRHVNEDLVGVLAVDPHSALE